MKPNAKLYNPKPKYFAQLVTSTGLSREALAEKLGTDRRTIDRWINGERQFPYIAQFAVECIVLMPD